MQTPVGPFKMLLPPVDLDEAEARMDPILFGGYKQSGYGREMGHAVLDASTQLKTAWMNLR